MLRPSPIAPRADAPQGEPRLLRSREGCAPIMPARIRWRTLGAKPVPRAAFAPRRPPAPSASPTTTRDKSERISDSSAIALGLMLSVAPGTYVVGVSLCWGSRGKYFRRTSSRAAPVLHLFTGSMMSIGVLSETFRAQPSRTEALARRPNSRPNPACFAAAAATCRVLHRPAVVGMRAGAWFG